MNIDIKTIQKGLESIGICSLGNDEWQEIFINPQEAAEVRHFLADIRTMRQDYFEYILHKLVEMSTAGKSVQSKQEEAMNDDFCSINDRPWEEQPCGCIHFPAFTEGHWTDNFGDGPRIWQAGTHFQAWTDTSGCREGHES